MAPLHEESDNRSQPGQKLREKGEMIKEPY